MPLHTQADALESHTRISPYCSAHRNEVARNLFLSSDGPLLSQEIAASINVYATIKPQLASK